MKTLSSFLWLLALAVVVVSVVMVFLTAPVDLGGWEGVVK